MFAVKVSCTRSCSRRGRSPAPVWLPVVFAILVLAVPLRLAQAEGTSLTPAEQAKVNRAIERGVQALNALQGPQGTWAEAREQHTLGYTALPGLTLLECDVPASDPPVQRAARAVRLLAPASTDTYDIALAILFLDRLGDEQDKELIQSLATRLVVGQTITGGWGYKCALVGKKDQNDLLGTLAKLDPQQGADQGKADQDTQPGSQDKDKPKDGGANQDTKPRPVVMAMIPPRLRGLSIFIQGVPRLVDRPGRDHEFVAPTTDNSNTQFAMLGLWAARKHGVPIKRSLDLILRRFKTSQNEDGGWGYRYREGGGEGAAGGGGGEAPTMTCAGLLGMAMGNGLAGKPLDKAKVDPAVRKGFVALSKYVGKPTGEANVRQGNLYLVWSIERVAVLFDLHTIGGKDWYRWASEMLLANQQEKGHWHNGGYWGSRPVIDTCFALLVLKRANLAADLGAQLPFEARALEREVNNEVNRVVDGKPASTPVGDINPTPAAPADSPFEMRPRQEQPATPAETPATAGTTGPQPNKSRTVLVALLVVCAVVLVGSIIALLVYLGCRRAPAPADDEDDYRPRRPTRYAR